MALPTPFTAATIVSEALNKAGFTSPAAAFTTRADTIWLRNYIKDIVNQADLKAWEKTQIAVLEDFKQRYALDNEFDKALSIKVLFGVNTSTAQGGTGTTITLNASEALSATFLKGKLIAITAGTAMNMLARIIDYNESTKVATVDVTWTTTPVSGDTYLIIDQESDLWPASREWVNDSLLPKRIPTEYYIYGSTPLKELHLNAIVDSSINLFGIFRARYIPYPDEIDLTDTQLTSFYNKYASLLIQAVFVEALVDQDDARATGEQKKLQRLEKIYLTKDMRERTQRGRIQMKSPGGMPLRQGRIPNADFIPPRQ